ncbi:uncharacterized protein LOC124790064 [Schistocerca piceifrons]|uniref:uncharacterized protein LOC124790064 n=1 Tax=Schistocerca piceifrons TaxID=274613 RepID=UPI001F5EC6D2|nr:uncharacterized protein LOC124790064 [Schistocerca piceifrons]
MRSLMKLSFLILTQKLFTTFQMLTAILHPLFNGCAELENQLKQTFTVSQELNAAKKRCNELESQLKEYTAVSTELNEYRERLQKNVQQLQDVQSSFTQLQSAFKSAQAESNMR